MLRAWLPQTWKHLFGATNRSTLVRRKPPSVRLGMEILEDRLTPTGNLAITHAFLVNASDQPLTAVSAGEQVYIQADFTTQDLPSNASYRVGYTVNGLTQDTASLTWGAGASGTSSWVAVL